MARRRRVNDARNIRSTARQARSTAHADILTLLLVAQLRYVGENQMFDNNEIGETCRHKIQAVCLAQMATKGCVACLITVLLWNHQQRTRPYRAVL